MPSPALSAGRCWLGTAGMLAPAHPTALQRLEKACHVPLLCRCRPERRRRRHFPLLPALRTGAHLTFCALAIAMVWVHLDGFHVR